MRVDIPGHAYTFDELDSYSRSTGSSQHLTFVMRNQPPEKYPGNPAHFPGTTSQEVFRALIDRHKYVAEQSLAMHDAQSYEENMMIIKSCRWGILVLERRAARRHNRTLKISANETEVIELMPTCRKCGHLNPERHDECK